MGNSLPQAAETLSNPFGIRPRIWDTIQNLRLMDDILMRVVLDGNRPAVELILRIILEKPDITVTELTVQKDLPSLFGRSLCLDVKAVDSKGKRYNIEVQRSDAEAGPKRARFHAAMLDVDFLKKGQKTDSLPESFVVFITENDYFGDSLPFYWFDRKLREGEKELGDGLHIVYANGAYRGDDAMGRLMGDFREPNL